MTRGMVLPEVEFRLTFCHEIGIQLRARFTLIAAIYVAGARYKHIKRGVCSRRQNSASPPIGRPTSRVTLAPAYGFFPVCERHRGVRVCWYRPGYIRVYPGRGIKSSSVTFYCRVAFMPATLYTSWDGRKKEGYYFTSITIRQASASANGHPWLPLISLSSYFVPSSFTPE